MDFIKKIQNDFKKLNLSEKAISLGLVFGVVFWTALDSIALGISLGFVFMIAFNEEEKKKCKTK